MYIVVPTVAAKTSTATSHRRRRVPRSSASHCVEVRIPSCGGGGSLTGRMNVAAPPVLSLPVPLEAKSMKEGLFGRLRGLFGQVTGGACRAGEQVVAVAGKLALVSTTLAVALAGTSLASPAGASVYTFPSVADSRVEQANASTNYGTLKIQAQGWPAIRTYIKFNVSALDGPVSSAKLMLWPDSASSTGFDVHGASSNAWSERKITWKNAPTVGATVASSGPYACC